MSKDIKKAAPGVADRKRHERIRIGNNATSSRTDCITESTKLQGISSFLARGKKNAITSSDLIELLGIPSKRELRHIIAKARENGEIILSDSNGYYLPSHGEEGLKEIEDCVRLLRAKAISTFKAAVAIKRTLKEVYGQEIIAGLDKESAGNGGGSC